MLKLNNILTGRPIYLCPSLVNIMEPGDVTTREGTVIGEGTIIYLCERNVAVKETCEEVIIMRDRAIQKMNDRMIQMMKRLTRDGDEWKGDGDAG